MASNGAVQDLRTALTTTIAERDGRKAAIDAEYEPRIKALREALAAVGDGEVVLGIEDQRPDTALSVGDDKLDFMREYFREHPQTRQADIARALQEAFNLTESSASGAASVGVRRLHQEGYIRPVPKRGGSNGWDLIGSLADV